jgi:hypothetical protein
MNSDYEALDATPGPELGAYDQLMQLDDKVGSFGEHPEADPTGSAYDELLDAN